MITVGLDFGTHQTKVCIESYEKYVREFTFITFPDQQGRKTYALPSVIGIDSQGLLHYGYLDPRLDNQQVIRYFKQSAFRNIANPSLSEEEAMLFSIWYLAYILFDLEELYGTEFTTQMGAPADMDNIKPSQRKATSIYASALRLVEDVFGNDKKDFLACNVDTLKSFTEILSYSDSLKSDYGLLVFPEAYACLMPLVRRGKINNGMSLLIDIGGGTTDISFFTIKNGKPQLYNLYSLDIGLNYLTKIETKNITKLDSAVDSEAEIDKDRLREFKGEIESVCRGILEDLYKKLRETTTVHNSFLTEALKNRPIIYSGGGSTFASLRQSYRDFDDVIYISDGLWRKSYVKEMDEIVALGLCPILTTAYGLSNHASDDNIKLEIPEIFGNFSNAEDTSRYRRQDYEDSKDSV